MATTKASKLLVIVLTIAALALTTSTLGAIVVSQNVYSAGTITTPTPPPSSAPAPTPTPTSTPIAAPNVGVYSDSDCTINKTSITWASVAAGGTATQIVYVKNTGTASMTLSLAVTNWTPSAAGDYMAITWNRQGTQLAPGQSVAATLTLYVSSSITGITGYSNTITISGSG